MSEVTLELLQNEIAQAKLQIKGLTAQVEAAKSMVNEGLQSNLMLRTNLTLFQQAHQEVTKELAEAKAKILELSPKEVAAA